MRRLRGRGARGARSGTRPRSRWCGGTVRDPSRDTIRGGRDRSRDDVRAMMDAIEIRSAAPGDLPALRCLFRRSSLSNEGDRAALLANPEALVLTADGVDEGRTRVAVTVQGTIVGFITTLVDENSVVELEDLFVDPAWMRQGIATRLVADLVEHSR